MTKESAKIFFVFLTIFMLFAKGANAATWIQTTDSDFNAGTGTNIEVTSESVNLGPAWTNLNTSTYPNNPTRNDFGGVASYTASNGQLILFGGANNGVWGDTWKYDYGTNVWSKLSPSSSPAARCDHFVAYDSTNQKVILFGGEKGLGGPMDNETWAYSGSNWAQKAYGPEVRQRHGMTYDSADHKMVVFGGVTSGWGRPTTTLIYDVNTDSWTTVNPSPSPSGREYPAMAYDSANNKVVLFGGTNGGDETWVYDVVGNTWTNKNPNPHPSSRDNPAMAYDPIHGKFIMFGGNFNDETWVYDVGSNQWTHKFPMIHPAGRDMAGMAYDSYHHKVLMHSGFGGSYSPLNDTWTFDLIASNGTLVSYTKDTGSPATWENISWTESLPSGTDLKFQIATSSEASPAAWNFIGPNGTSATYYTNPAGEAIYSGHNGNRYIKYKAFLSTSDNNYSPTLSEITISYVAPTTYYVDNNASDPGTGTQGDPFKTINSAEAVASSGDEIRVKQGTYSLTVYGPNNPGTITLESGVYLRGGYNNSWVQTTDPSTTIISGESSVRCLYGSGLSAATTIENFTIQNGYVNDPTYGGGGLYLTNSSPTISNCIFANNQTSIRGGGICNDYYCSPIILNCTFNNNSVSGSSYGGGGIFSILSYPTTIKNCTFNGNNAKWGGGIYIYSSNATITNCIITNNSGEFYGGGIANCYSSNSSITNCTLTGNSAAWGGGIYVYYGGSSANINNSIIYNNNASYSPKDIYLNLSGGGSLASANVTYSCIGDGGYGGTNGNIDADPLFANPPGDVHLQLSSLCIDTGTGDAYALGLGYQQGYGTNPDGIHGDSDIVDMGYHYSGYTQPTILSAYTTKVGNAGSWQWRQVLTGEAVPSGSPESWQWKQWPTGGNIPKGTAPSWTWESE